MKLGVISLGCDKATVDSERLVGDLVGHGATITLEGTNLNATSDKNGNFVISPAMTGSSLPRINVGSC